MDTQPSLEEWRQLYEAAIAFKEARPWEWMTEAHLFGVRNPETKEIGYGSIMGMRGEHFALAVYLGSEGLDGFWRMETLQEPDPAFLLEIPLLQASFEDRRELRRQDLQVIKSLGLKFRGRKAWPLFRSYVPGYFPWFLTAEEARFLTLALQQALEVALRVREDPTLLDPLQEGLYLVRTPERRGEALAWKDEWMRPPPLEARPSPPPIEEADLAAMRAQLPRRPIGLEVDLFIMPVYIRDKDDPRPYFPYILLAVESKSGFVLGSELLAPKPSLDAVWAKAPERFVDALRRLGVIPAKIFVARERVWRLLEPVATPLGIRLVQARSLPALERARAFLEQGMT